MMMGLSLNQLLTIYSIQFPVSKEYEKDTWYDAEGYIVHTNNRSISSSIGLSGKEWDVAQKVQTNVESNLNFDFEVEGEKIYNITYVKPYSLCSREDDYRTAWEFFSNKYGVKK